MAITTAAPPSLESGDHLTRAEFHRRYCARPDIRKAELIEGVVYVASSVRIPAHAQPTALILGWLTVYQSRHPDVQVADNGTLFLDDGNEVQPDAMVWQYGPGGPRLTDDGYLEGAPQLVIEVAASSVSIDLHAKLRAYQRNGVQEYMVWRALDQEINWFGLRDGVYERMEPDRAGVLVSVVFPGLRLDVAKLLAGDVAGVLGALEGVD